MTEEFRGYMQEGLDRLDLKLSEEQLEKFFVFYEDIIETNKVMNMTAITELRDVVFKHFIDSLAIIKAVPDIGDKDYNIIDIGTGAGLPGIPIAIAWPNVKIFLLDSVGKRIKFIINEAEKLGLTGLTAEHGRAEDIAGDPNHREKYDIGVSRAVANLSTLSEYCLPFIHIGGNFIPYKSGEIDAEVLSAKHAIAVLGGENTGIFRFLLPGDEAGRTLVVINKKSKTPHKFPRKAGIPSKEPL